ncbi:MAG: ATP-binding protein [Deltaproteobacteria bacterium]|nr:ATP-binding protein [Deltaproteobacteria bacterium]
MKKLVVLSGKGGTGKTTVSAALATYWAHRAVYVDADVDAANLHLVLRPMENELHPFWGGVLPWVDAGLCDGCGRCTDVCRFGAIAAGRVSRVSCEGCGACAGACPVGAIELKERHVADWYLGRTTYGPLLHARLLSGEGNSGKLVAVLKEEAEKVAAGERAELLLCDGPPGVACPVLASMAGMDAVLAVAEPSAAGLHDLRRILDLAERFRLACSVALNRSDTSEDARRAILEECGGRGVPVEAEIPFDPTVLSCTEKGTPVTTEPGSPAARALWSLSRALAQRLERL